MHLKTALRYGVIGALVVILIGARTGYAAPLFQDPVWTITGPAEGSTVGGQVAIQGTATHPTFDSYGVLYASGPRPTADSQWIPIAFGVKSMVVNGTLATWDTSNLPNGVYTLALALYEVGNSDPKLHFTNNITVFNAPPTPTLSPTPTETPAAPETPPDDPLTPPGEVPAVPVGPTVEQPPTATPRPTATPGPVAAPGADDADDGVGDVAALLSMAAIKEAVVTGIWLAVFFYILGGLYQLGKIAVRYYIRQLRRKQGVRNS